VAPHASPAHLDPRRTGEGRERAKARGVRFGRPKKLSAYQPREAIERVIKQVLSALKRKR
jgi:hypothetical protein